MTIKTTGALKLTDITSEFEIEGQEADFPISLLAAEADLEAPHMWSEFYGMSSGPREFFTSFSITPSKHQHTVQWSLGRDDGDSPEPSCKVFVYGQQGDSVVVGDDTLLNPDGAGFDLDQTVFQFDGGYNRNWTLRLEIRNDRGSKFSEPKYFQAIPTLPSFDSALSTLRDPRSVGDENSQHLVGVIFDLTDEIPFEEGYEIEVFYKANDNQDFAQIDSTISRSTAMNANSPIKFSFAKGDDMANQAKTVILDGFRFELFTRYTVLLFIRWTGQVAEARGVVDFAGDRPDIPVLGAVQAPNTIQLSWQHDDKSIKYELYHHDQEVGIDTEGTKIYEVTGDEPVTTYTHQIGYNESGWYLVKAYTKYSEAKSSPKQSATLTTKPELDGTISLLRDPNFSGYAGQEDVDVSWDMKDGGPTYSEGYTVEIYWRKQTTDFLDSTLTHENADNAGSPFVISGRKGSGPQTASISSMKFERLSKYTLLMKLKWTGQELAAPARALLMEAGKVPDPARGFTAFASSQPKAIDVQWSHDDKAETYELYGSPTHGSDLSQTGVLLDTKTQMSPSFEYRHALDYSKTYYYQVFAKNEYATIPSGIKSATTNPPAIQFSGSAVRSGAQQKDITVSWSVHPTDLTDYDITIQKDGSNLTGFNPNSNSATFTYAAPQWNQSYQIKVTLQWKDKENYFNANVHSYTPPPLTPPKNLSLSQVTGNTSRAIWQQGNSSQTPNSYSIRWKYWRHGENENSAAWQGWINNVSTTWWQTTLSSFYYYKFQVRVASANVSGVTITTPSPEATSSTYKVGTPASVSITKRANSTSTTNYLRLTFNDKTLSNYTGYKVYWKNSSTSVWDNGQIIKNGAVSARTIDTEHNIGANQTIDYKLVAWWAVEASPHVVESSIRIGTTDSWKFRAGITIQLTLINSVAGGLVAKIQNVYAQNSSGQNLNESVRWRAEFFQVQSNQTKTRLLTKEDTCPTYGSDQINAYCTDLFGGNPPDGYGILPPAQYQVTVTIFHSRDSSITHSQTVSVNCPPHLMRWLTWPDGGKVWQYTQGTGRYSGTFTRTSSSDNWNGSNTTTYRERMILELVSAANNQPITPSGQITAFLKVGNGVDCPRTISNGKIYFDVNVGDWNRIPLNTLKLHSAGGKIGTHTVTMPDQSVGTWGYPQVPAPAFSKVDQFQSGPNFYAGFTAKWSNARYNWAGSSNLGGKYYMYSSARIFLTMKFSSYTLGQMPVSAPCFVGTQSTATSVWTVRHNMNCHASLLKAKYMRNTAVGSFSNYVIPTHVNNNECRINVGGNYTGIVIIELLFGDHGIGGNYSDGQSVQHFNYGYHVMPGSQGCILRFKVSSDGTVTGISTDYFFFRSHYWINSNASYFADLKVYGNYG